MRHFLSYSIKAIILALVVVIILRVFFIQTEIVSSESMEPTLKVNDHILILKNKFLYENPHIKRHQIVIFLQPDNQKELLIKRVIGLPNEVLTLKDEKVYINNKKLKELYVINNLPNYSATEDDELFKSFIIPNNHYFVMGDNRANSEDSRTWGAIPERLIKGRAWLIYWPPWRIQFIR